MEVGDLVRIGHNNVTRKGWLCHVDRITKQKDAVYVTIIEGPWLGEEQFAMIHDLEVAYESRRK